MANNLGRRRGTILALIIVVLTLQGCADDKPTQTTSSGTNMLFPIDLASHFDSISDVRVEATLGAPSNGDIASHPALGSGLDSELQALVDKQWRYTEWHASVQRWISGSGSSTIDIYDLIPPPGTPSSPDAAIRRSLRTGVPYKFWLKSSELLPGRYYLMHAAFLTVRQSVTSSGAEANGLSHSASIAGDGSLVAFASEATNLVASDTNGLTDVFLRNGRAGTTARISQGLGGSQGNGWSGEPDLSEAARWAVFTSEASNLVSGDTNGVADIFLRDLDSGVTTLISKPETGESNGASWKPFITANGRFIVFESDASNLVGVDTNGVRDVFIFDRKTDSRQLVSLTSAGAAAGGSSDSGSASEDGRYVVFVSQASNLVALDTNAAQDIFMRDRTAGTTVRVSLGPSGVQANAASGDPSVTADGRYVAFSSTATNLVTADTNGSVSDVFLTDTQPVVTSLVSVSSLGVQSVGASGRPFIDRSGRFIAFWSNGALVPTDLNGAADVYVRARGVNKTSAFSVNSLGVVSNADSAIKFSVSTPVCCGRPELSNDGRVIAYESAATNLVPGDGNGVRDVYSTRLLFE